MFITRQGIPFNYNTIQGNVIQGMDIIIDENKLVYGSKLFSPEKRFHAWFDCFSMIGFNLQFRIYEEK